MEGLGITIGNVPVCCHRQMRSRCWRCLTEMCRLCSLCSIHKSKVLIFLLISLYNVLQNLRDVHIDDIDWDNHSEVSSRRSVDEPVQVTFKGRNPSVNLRRTIHKNALPRPETKVSNISHWRSQSANLLFIFCLLSIGFLFEVSWLRRINVVQWF